MCWKLSLPAVMDNGLLWSSWKHLLQPQNNAVRQSVIAVYGRSVNRDTDVTIRSHHISISVGSETWQTSHEINAVFLTASSICSLPAKSLIQQQLINVISQQVCLTYVIITMQMMRVSYVTWVQLQRPSDWWQNECGLTTTRASYWRTSHIHTAATDITVTSWLLNIQSCCVLNTTFKCI